MSDALTLMLQTMEKKYAELKQAFAADGKVTAEEAQVLKDVQAKIDDLRQKTQARAAQLATGSVKGGVSLEGSKELKSKGGHKVGLVGGLHAQVACEVGPPAGEKRLYPVKLTVSFGASAKVSGNAGKDGSVGVELKKSAGQTMVLTHNLSDSELGVYIEGLRAASSGAKVAGKQREFEIIAVGVKQGWAIAQQLWETGMTLSADSLKKPGDSMEITQNRTSGVGVNAKAKGVGVGYGDTDSHDKKVTATLNEKGAVDVKADNTFTGETKRSGSLDVGAVGLEVGAVHTKKTSYGYTITIDPKNDPGGKLLEWLGWCTSPQDYQVFMAANWFKITVIDQRTGKATTDASSIGVSILGAKASIGTHQGVDEETVTDRSGKLIKKTVVGKAGAGGEALGHSDSVQEEAVAEIDGKGQASVTLTRTKTDGTVDKSGLRLSNDDLTRIGKIAVGSLDSWMGAVRRADEKADWKAAGIAIAKANGAASTVAEQLARFVGGDRVERMKTVQNFLRGGYGGKGGIGRKFEFPEAIKRLQESYEVVTAEALPKKLDELAASNPAAAVEKCKSLLAIVDLVDPQIRKNEDFENNAVKMEMLDRLVHRRKLLAEGMKAWSGSKKPDEDPALLEAAANRLQKQLSSFSVEQAKVGAKLHELLGGYPKFNVADLGDAKELIRQLNDMHNRWSADYGVMRETMAKRGVKNWDIPMLKPDAAMLAKYEKAAGLS